MSDDAVPRAPRIVLVRHGRSAHASRGWLDARGLRAWFAAYDAAGLAHDDAPPAVLRAEAARAGVVVASDLPRAHASAQRLLPGVEIARSPLLRETPLAVPALGRLRLPLLAWALLVGAHAAVGALRGVPPRDEVRAQAAAASAWLLELVARHDAVLAVTHANVRAHVAAALVAQGWSCARRGRRYAHWSAWTFVPGAHSPCVQAPAAGAGDDAGVGPTSAASVSTHITSPEPAR